MSARCNPCSSYRVLIVDDDETDVRHYKRLLGHKGLAAGNVNSAPDGTAGLTALHEEGYDCVLLDFRLPDMTGLVDRI